MSHLLVNSYSKVIYKTVDNSTSMKTWNSDNMTVTDDYIYIGMPHTFAARFFFLNSVNAVSSSMTVEYYAGSSTWNSVRNFADETRSGAVTLAKHGFISWDLPTDWIKNQVEGLPEIDATSKDGRGYYYIRIGFSINISAVVEWLGLLWTNQDYMAQRWPEVISARFLPVGKDHWYELIEISTGDVGKDLEYSNILEYELQAKDIGEMAELTALKTLINILIPLVANETYRKMKEYFEQLYDIARKARLRSIDTNNDEKINVNEAQGINSFKIRRV